MDQGPLVIEQIDAGMGFINRLHEHVPVRAAFWMKATEDGRWYLYVASDKINEHTKQSVYPVVSRVVRDLGNPNLDQFRVRLLGSDDPLARAAIDFQHRFVGRVPTRVRGREFGGFNVVEVYIYPPPPYGADAEKWRGISVEVWPELRPEGAYRVEFWPNEPASMVPWPGEPKRIPRPAGVLVKDGQILEYRPPEKALPHLSQRDYEKKALEAVEQVVAKGN
jgi:hypothetical protein